MKKFLFYFAFTGWILALIAHLISLAGFDITEKVPFVWILHIGCIFVLSLAILNRKKYDDTSDFKESVLLEKLNDIGLYTISFKHTPNWMRLITIGGLIYAFFNFMSFMYTQPGSPEIQNGNYVLLSHDQPLKTLTKQEYHHYKANEIRGFSGHWIAFYGIAVSLLFPSDLATRNKQQIPKTMRSIGMKYKK